MSTLVYCELCKSMTDRTHPSYEYMHMRPAFDRLGFDVHEYSFFERMEKIGKEAMNEELVQTCRDVRADFLFTVLFQDQIVPETIKRVSDLGVITINWACDDHWRFDVLSRTYAPFYDFWCTTDRRSYPRYQSELNYDRAILTQWAVNEELFYPDMGSVVGLSPVLSWVGQVYGTRESMLSSVSQKLPLRVYDFIPLDSVRRVYSTSRAVLNLSEGFIEGTWTIKGRVFEVPACAGLLLTQKSPYIEDFYTLGQEIIVWRSVDDLVERFNYYLHNDRARVNICQAGYHRTVQDHTYVKRLTEIFSKVRERG